MALSMCHPLNRPTIDSEGWLLIEGRVARGRVPPIIQMLITALYALWLFLVCVWMCWSGGGLSLSSCL